MSTMSSRLQPNVAPAYRARRALLAGCAIPYVAVVVGALLVTACSESDIGSDCPSVAVPTPNGASTEGDVVRTQGSEIVEYDAQFPCESTVCIATLGKTPYCSKECSTDAQCPDAFECRQVMELGPFAERKYCAWRECVSDSSCGDRDDTVCEPYAELSIGNPVSFCAWR